MFRMFLIRWFAFAGVAVAVTIALLGFKLSLSAGQIIWLGGMILASGIVAASVVETHRAKLVKQLHTLALTKARLDSEREEFDSERAISRKAVLEKAVGLPTLLTALQQYQAIHDESLSKQLATKKHPARKAADTVREEGRRRREAEKRARMAEAIVEYYESIAPFLVDYREELDEEVLEETERWQHEYSEAERDDLATRYLTKEEYRRLSPGQRNALALDRYWARRHAPAELGRMYERYVGYLYEQDGHRVRYQGIESGLEDLGRDLICERGDLVLVVQCKNWSRDKVIREKHLFQLYGSLFLFQRDNPGGRARGVFATTTVLSAVARDAASFLGVEVREGSRSTRRTRASSAT